MSKKENKSVAYSQVKIKKNKTHNYEKMTLPTHATGYIKNRKPVNAILGK